MHPLHLGRSGRSTIVIICAIITLAILPGARAQPTSVTLAGQSFTNQGLVGVGRLPANLRDKYGETFGSFSAFTFDPRTWQLYGTAFSGTLYAQPDRGYNVAGTMDYTSRLNILTVNFTPAPGGAALQNQVGLTLNDTIQYKETSGVGLTSIDPASAGTGSRAGFPALPQAFNGKISLDPEGIVRLSDGSFYVSDEYGPYLYRFSSTGTLLSAIRPPDALIPVRNGADSFASNNPGPGQPAPVPVDPFTGRQNNQGLEGLTLTPDGRYLAALLQSATRQDGGTGGSGPRRNTRLLLYDITSNPSSPTLVAEHIIQLPTYLQGTSTRVAAQSEMVALNNKQFLVLARDGNGHGTATPTSLFRNILLYDITSATNIAGTAFDTAGTAVAPGGVLLSTVTPAQSVALIDLNNSVQLAKFGLHNGPTDDANNLSEKWEGLALVPALDAAAPNDVYLFVGNDNDFLTADGFQAGSAYNAGLENDSMVLVYRLTLPTYVDPLALASASVTGIPLVQALSGQALGLARLGTRDIGGHLAALRLGRASRPGVSVFADGDWSKVDDDAHAGYSGFSADSWSATGGIDWQLGEKLTFGVATSRLEGEAEINGSRDTIEAEGTGFSGFFSIKAETVYLEASYTRNELDYEMSRNTAAYGLSAIGETKGTSSIARLQAGWHRSFGEWLLTAEVGVDRVKAQIDSFTESGAIHLNLLVPTLTPHSTQWHGRVQLAREISCGALRLSLYGAAEFIHEPSPTPQEFTLVLAGRTGVSGASIAGETPVGQRNLWRGQIGVAGALTDKLRFNVEGVTSLNRDYGKQTAVQAALNYHF